jgi:undecaprenyl-diphosphatase
MDLKLLVHINEKFRHDILDRIMPRITVLGDGGVLWIMVALAFIFKGSTRVVGEMLISALILTTILGEGLIKHIIRRARPFMSGIEEKLLIVKPITYSFPSGHTSSSFAAAGVLFAVHSRLAVLAFVLASLIAFSRIYLNVHYPTDVFIGIVLGLFCAQTVVNAFRCGFPGSLHLFSSITIFY